MSRQFILVLCCLGNLVPPGSPSFAQNAARSEIGNKSILRPSSQPPVLSKNELIAVQARTVTDTLPTGEIFYAGLFNIGTADGRPLLFNYPQEPFSSHFNVRIDGAVYSNDPQETGALPLQIVDLPRLLSDSTIACTFRTGTLPILIEQRLKPQIFGERTAAILIEYRLINADNVTRRSGVLLELDMNIAGKDDISVLTSFGYSRNEQEFPGPLFPIVPDLFQAFDVTRIFEPLGLVGQGTVVGFQAVPPDKIIVADWDSLKSVQWDYAISQSNRYNDSAVLLRWNERPLAPGESRRIATYFGIGNVTRVVEPTGQSAVFVTALERLRAQDGQINPNPFDIDLLVLNASSIQMTGVQGTLSLPPGLSLVSYDNFNTKSLTPPDPLPGRTGTASWKVIAQCPPADANLAFDVEVSSSGSPVQVQRSIFVPSCPSPDFRILVAPDTIRITAGDSASFQVRMQSLAGFNQSVSLSYFPPVPGIAGNFTPMIISPSQSSTFKLRSDRNLRSGTYAFIVEGTSGSLARSDVATVIVQAAPPLDTSPPFFTNHNPAQGATEIPLNTTISLEVRDDQSGVDSAKIEMSIAGVRVTPVFRGDPSRYTISYTPAQRFGLNSLVQVKVVAADRSRPQNVDSTVYSFTTIADREKPYLAGQNPAPASRDVPLNAAISAEILDDLAGVDSASIVMGIGNRVVSPGTSRITKGFRVDFQPPRFLVEDTTYRVVFGARDLVGNQLGVFYTFSTIKDFRGPNFFDLSPIPNARDVPLDYSLSARVRDDLTGVDSTSIQLRLNGQIVAPSVMRESQGFLISLIPSSPLRYDDTVHVEMRAHDLSRAKNEAITSFAFYAVRDNDPPFTTGHRPARFASNILPGSEIFVEVRDQQAGVDSASIQLSVNGNRVTPVLSGNPAKYELRFTPVNASDTVRVKISASDLSSSRHQLNDEYYYVLADLRDRNAPFTRGHDPAPNARNVPLESSITLKVLDFAPGVDSSSISMSVNGIVVNPAITGSPQEYTLHYDPPEKFRDSQTVVVTVKARDLALPPNEMPAETYSFTTVRDSLAPRILDRFPAAFATNVPEGTELSLRIEDELTGVDRPTLRLQINGSDVSPEIASLPNGFLLRHRVSAIDTVRVRVNAQDQASNPNKLVEEYFFVTAQDTLPPYSTMHNPAPNATNVPVSSPISVVIKDDHSGVDPNSLRMKVNGNSVNFEVSGDLRAREIMHTPPMPWGYNGVIAVRIQASDFSNPPHWLDDRYSFAVIKDTTAPVIVDLYPAPSATGIPSNIAVTFSLIDEGAGVDQASIVLLVDNEESALELTGTPRRTNIRYQPRQGFPSGAETSVSISARDLSSPPNETHLSYRFSTQKVLPDLVVSDLEYRAGPPARLRGRISLLAARLASPPIARFYLDEQALQDTAFVEFQPGQELDWTIPLLVEDSGTHSVELVVDPDNEIAESSETNNRQRLSLEIQKALVARLIVRPNPFTPNADGYNDEVVFNFEGLSVASPTLHIFDVNGISILQKNEPRGKSFAWDGQDSHSRPVPPGVYFYTFRDRGRNLTSGYVVVAR